MRKLIIILLLCTYNTLYAQTIRYNFGEYQKKNYPNLSKVQMYEDFDSLRKYVEELFPFGEIILKTTGVNINSEMIDIRKKIDTVTNISSYYLLIEEVVCLLNDGHFGTAAIPVFQKSEWLTNFKLCSIDSVALENTKTYGTKTGFLNNKMKFYISFRYINGEYFNIYPFEFNDKVYPVGLKIITLNGQDIHEFVKVHNNERSVCKYDYINKRFYNERFFWSFSLLDLDTLVIEFEDTLKQKVKLKFPVKQAVKIIQDRKKPTSKLTKIVSYIKESKSLYLRLPTMNPHPDYKLTDSVNKIISINEVENIIIDVRDNGGGNDAYWEELMYYLLGDYSKKEQYCGNNSYLFKKYLKYYLHNDTLVMDCNKLALLDSNYCCITAWRKLTKADTSIHFKGHIYIFTNDNVFSSCSSFLLFVSAFKDITTIGVPSGFICYSGFRPMPFVFPNSKMIFLTPINFDYSNIHELKDFFFQPVYCIQENLLYYFKYFSTDDQNYYNHTNLLQFDPYYKKFCNIELIK